MKKMLTKEVTKNAIQKIVWEMMNAGKTMDDVVDFIFDLYSIDLKYDDISSFERYDWFISTTVDAVVDWELVNK